MDTSRSVSRHDFGEQVQTVLAVSEGLESILVPGAVVDSDVVEMLRELRIAAGRLARFVKEDTVT